MQPLFEFDGELLVPAEKVASVWSPDIVNGAQVGGLVAWGVERDHGSPEFQLTRLTVDMFRQVPMRPLRIATEVLRAGRRIKVIGVHVLDGDVEVTRGSAMFLLRSEHPPGNPWAAPDEGMPGPGEFPGQPPRPPGASGPAVSFEIRRDGSREQAGGRPRAWVREPSDFVPGTQPSPAVRAAMAADFCNPLANSAPAGLAFINTDFTLHLVRDPVGDWIGLESAGHLGTHGVGIGTAAMFDETGRIGMSTACALPDPRLRSRVAAPASAQAP